MILQDNGKLRMQSAIVALALFAAFTGNLYAAWAAAAMWLVTSTSRPGVRCFSEHARMMRSDGVVVPIASVHQGMRLITANGRVASVSAIQRHAAAPVVFLRMTTADGFEIETTPDHYIVTSNGFVLASEIREGVHYLRKIDNSWTLVQSIERVSTCAPTFNVWLSGTPYVCVNGLIATPACMSNALVPLVNQYGMLSAMTSAYASLVRHVPPMA